MVKAKGVPQRRSGNYWVHRYDNHPSHWEVAEYYADDFDWELMGCEGSFPENVARETLIKKVGPRIPDYNGETRYRDAPHAATDHTPDDGPSLVQQALDCGYSEFELAWQCGIKKEELLGLLAGTQPLSFAMQVLLEQFPRSKPGPSYMTG